MLSIIWGAIICTFVLSTIFLVLALLCLQLVFPLLPEVPDEHETAYDYDAPVITQSLTNPEPAAAPPSYPVTLRPSRIRAEESPLVPSTIPEHRPPLISKRRFTTLTDLIEDVPIDQIERARERVNENKKLIIKSKAQ